MNKLNYIQTNDAGELLEDEHTFFVNQMLYSSTGGSREGDQFKINGESPWCYEWNNGQIRLIPEKPKLRLVR